MRNEEAKDVGGDKGGERGAAEEVLGEEEGEGEGGGGEVCEEGGGAEGGGGGDVKGLQQEIWRLELELARVSERITVVQVIREMGIETSNRLDWEVGKRMQRWYSQEVWMGELPFKDNGKKTNGGGNHCFAKYEPCFRKRIQKIVMECEHEIARQRELFGEGDEWGVDAA